MEELNEKDRRQAERFGLIASATVASNPYRKGSVPKPGDWFREGRSGLPVTENDWKRLAHRMGPTRSIKA